MPDKLREALNSEAFSDGYQRGSHDSERECKEECDRKIEQAKREERERIIKDLHSVEFESDSAQDFLNKTMYYIRQALKDKEE